MHSPTLFD